MANIWKQNKDVTQKIKRNNHDLSYDNHATFKMGYLYPVFRKAVVPGDSFRIRSAFDLKLMPLVFPLQTRLRAHLHFFYVRYKNVWKDFEDYMTGVHRNNPLVEPYIAPADNKVTTGSIYDFLGVPTTLVTKAPIIHNFDILGYGSKTGVTPVYYKSVTGGCQFGTLSTGMTGQAVFIYINNPISSADFVMPVNSTIRSYIESLGDSTGQLFYLSKDKLLLDSSFGTFYTFNVDTEEHKVKYSFGSSNFVDYVNRFIAKHGNCVLWAAFSSSTSLPEPFESFMPVDFNDCKFTQSVSPSSGFHNYSDLSLNLYRDKLHLKAMPFRVYESVYRSYYANDVLQPLIDGNGDAQYNKFCTTQEGGLDTTDYALFKRNYELDFLTSAYPSPQAGPAPLVGISALGNITIEDENGITTAKAVVDDDGHVTSVSVTSPLASIEHGRTLVNIAQAGININDFRNANALQKFLEQTLRSGYRYIDFIRGQWGVKPKDQALDMPEFIGGFSRDVVIQTITSLADNMDLNSDDNPLSKQLGGFGANGRVIGGSDFSINKFCDDYGEIIGVMCVTPTPAYSQLLDKSMIAGDNYLSFPFPQFNQLGMQPIPYKEVAPIQAYLDMLEDSSKSLEDTFGYQRPNYNLVGSVDEVHGEFRGSLRQYLINRIFDGRPELSSAFLEIDPSEVNDVFVNQNPDDDVLIGHLRFKVDTKRPFPRIHMPGL